MYVFKLFSPPHFEKKTVYLREWIFMGLVATTIINPKLEKNVKNGFSVLKGC